MNIAVYVIVGLLTGLLVPSLAIWLFSLSDTEHTHRCIRAADVCNFNRLAIVWQLFATGLLPFHGQRERQKRDKISRCFYFCFSKSGPVHTGTTRPRIGGGGVEDSSAPSTHNQFPEMGPVLELGPPAIGPAITNNNHHPYIS